MEKNIPPNEPAHHIAVFQETTIRRVWHNEEWWFAIVDVVGVLSDSADPRQYIKKMRSRDPALDANWGTTCTPLALQAPDGKKRETNCANTGRHCPAHSLALGLPLVTHNTGHFKRVPGVKLEDWMT